MSPAMMQAIALNSVRSSCSIRGPAGSHFERSAICWKGGSRANHLRVATMNVQSLNNNVDKTFQMFLTKNLDILLLQETCLDRESLNANHRMAKKRKITFHATNPKSRTDGVA